MSTTLVSNHTSPLTLNSTSPLRRSTLAVPRIIDHGPRQNTGTCPVPYPTVKLPQFVPGGKTVTEPRICFQPTDCARASVGMRAQKHPKTRPPRIVGRSLMLPPFFPERAG